MSSLETRRLRIEPLRAGHASSLWGPLQDPILYTYLPKDPPTRDELDKRYEFLERRRSPDGTEHWLNWVAFLRDTDTPVGTFQATLPEGRPGLIAYVLFRAFWKQGLARELSRTLVSYLFRTYPVERLTAEIDTRNTASLRLVESLGFTRVSTTPAADFFKGASSDEHTYAVDRADWLQGASPGDRT